MKDTIFAIIISLIASFIYDVLKNFFPENNTVILTNSHQNISIPLKESFLFHFL